MFRFEGSVGMAHFKRTAQLRLPKFCVSDSLLSPCFLKSPSIRYLSHTNANFPYRVSDIFSSRWNIPLNPMVEARLQTRPTRTIPSAIQTGGGEAYGYSEGGHIGPPPDLPSLLMNERIIYLGLPLTPRVTELIIAQLLYLDYESASKSITMYINSPGSEANNVHLPESEALAIADVMNYISAPVHSVCVGQAYGTAAMLLANGKLGCRYSLPNATILVKQPYSGMDRAQASDVAGTAKELLHTRDQIVRILAKASGKDFGSVLKDVQRNKYLNPEEAVEYGIIDAVLQKPAITLPVGL